VEGLTPDLQKVCYSAFIDAVAKAKNQCGKGTAVSLSRKLLKDVPNDLLEASSKIDSLPDFAFYDQLAFHRPNAAAKMGLKGLAAGAAGPVASHRSPLSTEWESTSPSQPMSSVFATSLTGVLKDFQHAVDQNSNLISLRLATNLALNPLARARRKRDEGDDHVYIPTEEQGGFSFDTRPVQYDRFLATLKLPSSSDLRKDIETSTDGILEGPKMSLDRTMERVQSLMEVLEAAMLNQNNFKVLGEQEQDNACEALEKHVITRLRPRVFSAYRDQKEKDAELRLRISKLKFLKPQHFDIPQERQHDEAWDRAIDNLHAFSHASTPKEKLDAVLQTGKHIYSVPTLNGSKSPMSADDFLPILIYLVIRANPPEFQSNLDFVSCFRASKRMIGESAYFFTHLAGAAYFIEHVDASKLSIDPREFAMHMAESEGNVSAAADSHTSDRDPISSDGITSTDYSSADTVAPDSQDQATANRPETNDDTQSANRRRVTAESDGHKPGSSFRSSSLQSPSATQSPGRPSLSALGLVEQEDSPDDPLNVAAQNSSSTSRKKQERFKDLFGGDGDNDWLK